MHKYDAAWMALIGDLMYLVQSAMIDFGVGKDIYIYYDVAGVKQH